jgi:hypothetical protein
LKRANFDSSPTSSVSSSTIRARFEDEINGEICVPAQIITPEANHWREAREQRRDACLTTPQKTPQKCE